MTVLKIKPTSNLFVEFVAVGNTAVEDSKEEPHVIFLVAVPVIAICKFCPSVGVPDKFVVNDVISADCAVRE